MKHSMKMHSKILILCLVCTLTALILQTLLFQKTSSELIYNQTKEESFNSLQNMQDDIYSFIKSAENGIIAIYNEKDFIKDLKNNTEIETLKSQYYRLAYNMGVNNFDSKAGVVALYLYDEKNQIISTYRRAVTPKHNYPTDIYLDPEMYNAETVKKYVQSDNTTMLITSYYNKAREKDIIRFVLKLYNNSNAKQVIGYVVCDIDTKVIRYIMEKYCVDEEMFIWLQPMGDRPILSLGNLSEDEMKNYEKLASVIQKGTTNTEQTLSDSNRVFFQVKQSKYNLDAYSFMSHSLLNENQKTLTRNLLLIASIMIVFALLLSSIVSKTLTRPLERMTKTALRIKEGETQLRMTNCKDDEIGELGRSFNEMLDQIKNLIGREYETKLMLNRAEYKALQAQINPHFLYNTLDTMSSIADVMECTQVSTLSQSLSNIFRYSLDMKNPFSTVAKEIVHLKNYIYVMNVRMQDEVTYIFDIEDDILNDSIPRISIQPLVENALNHGLRNSHNKKAVTIRAKKQDMNLQIIVEDNGVGMTRDQIDQLLNLKDQNTLDKATSIGLRNIDSRMKMLYGDEYGVTIESEIGIGTKVFLSIPRRKLEEVELWRQKSIKS